jgi:hypothetical protein
MCDGSNHNLKIIYIDHGLFNETVVRWCEDCGAVVVDKDVDGRTYTGYVRKMQFPKYRKKDDNR